MPAAPWQNWTSLSSGHVVWRFQGSLRQRSMPNHTKNRGSKPGCTPSFALPRDEGTLPLLKRQSWLMPTWPLNPWIVQRNKKTTKAMSNASCYHFHLSVHIIHGPVHQLLHGAPNQISSIRPGLMSESLGGKWVFYLLHLRLSSRANASSAGNCSKVWRIPAIPWAAPK